MMAAVRLFLSAVFLTATRITFAEPSGGGYLSGYPEIDPRPTAVSWWSTLAYLLSLLAVFAFVAALAYFASRFLSSKFRPGAVGDGGSLLAHLALGPNRSVCVVELAGRVFMLGVTEHSITLLTEVTDAEEIERLRSGAFSSDGRSIFSDGFGAFDQITRRIPSFFKDGEYRK